MNSKRQRRLLWIAGGSWALLILDTIIIFKLLQWSREASAAILRLVGG